MLAHKGDQLRRIATLPDNLKARALKQAREALAQENIIIGERNPSRVCGHGKDYRPSATRRSTVTREIDRTSRCRVVLGVIS
jgi:hypothetical protein